MQLTILTPTYNRENCLGKLYESLQNQTNKEFEWVVVDDGSTDNTKALISRLGSASDFPIKYIYKENGGKHTALNEGVRQINSELTFIVDSDDMLTPDAVNTIYEYHRKYKDNVELCGYSFLRIFPDGKVNGKYFKRNEWIASLIDSRINSDDSTADKAEVYYTRILKAYPFPEYPGEKFLGEDIVWIRIAKKYKMVHINKGIYIGSYLTEGLTSNRRRYNICSPVGCMNRAIEYMDPSLKMKYRIKGALQFAIYGRFAGYQNLEVLKKSPYKAIMVLAIIPGNIIFHRWKQLYVNSK